ncbi:hypothetical protein PAP10c_2340 [Pantoea agglomerans]|nr:hypothetical protein PAP10c_2340 [Pantoea agglomerans]
MKHGIEINLIDKHGNNALMILDSDLKDYLNIAKLLLRSGISLEVFEKDASKLNLVYSSLVKEKIIEYLVKKENKHINKNINSNEHNLIDISKRKRL